MRREFMSVKVRSIRYFPACLETGACMSRLVQAT